MGSRIDRKKTKEKTKTKVSLSATSVFKIGLTEVSNGHLSNNIYKPRLTFATK